MIVDVVRRFFDRHHLPPRAVVVAASAGIDSTALLLAMSELREERLTVRAAHVNHHLRGSESDDDERFVRDLCARLDVPLHVEDGTLDPAAVRERGIEAAAREVRYARLAAIRGDALIATAHQKDDQAETVLMRLLTGGGIAALRGIHPVRDDGVIRPLLEVTREEIEAFLRERGVTPRVDRSNADPRFLRNRVRVVLRELAATNNLAALAEQARAVWPLLERAIDHAERVSVEVRDNEVYFHHWPEDPWIRGALLQRHIRRLDPGARDFDAARLADEAGRIKRVSVTKNLELIGNLLRKRLQPIAEFEIELTPDAPAYIPETGVTVYIGQRSTGSGQRFQLPKNATPIFTVRNRRNGDRFHPLGLAGEKKLKDFLIDRKIAAELRASLPLLIWNDEIVWVGGVEVSERFKVTDPAGELYEVWMEGSGASLP